MQQSLSDYEGKPGDVLELIRMRNIRFIDLVFTDLGGRPWQLTMAADRANEAWFDAGQVVEGPSVGPPWPTGRLCLRPDPAAAFMQPFAAVPTLALMCDVWDVNEGAAHARDGREVLKRAMAALAHENAGSLNVGIEPEFFVSEEPGRPAPDEIVRETLTVTAAALTDAGIRVDWFRCGPFPGQGRVQMRAGHPVRMADQVVMYRRIVHAVARRLGRTVTFLPKPWGGPGGLGMPVHHALWRDGKNLFDDPNGWARTSETARRYAGGLLQHAAALAAVCAPNTNSYRRLAADGAPVDVALSEHRWTAVCRIPPASKAPEARRVRFGVADPSANPYLAIAAMLLAGLDGIVSATEPPVEEGRGRLPRTLHESLEALEADSDFLRRGGAFSEELLRAWIDERRAESTDVSTRPHPRELELYREV